jgi:solute carrier family 25 (mitochondrial phosphate transporter), member 3
MEEARIKMVGDPQWAKMNTVTAFGRLIKENGLFATFAGLPAMLSKQVPYTMSKQVSFDIFASWLYALVEMSNFTREDVKWGISLTAAFLASILACLSSQPGDMILTATYKGKSNLGVLGIVKDIYSKQGISGFFTGIQARIAHVAAIITLQLVLYDIIKIALNLPTTGSH